MDIIKNLDREWTSFFTGSINTINASVGLFSGEEDTGLGLS